jgi:DNA-binding CsgD family transcriptional regulator
MSQEILSQEILNRVEPVAAKRPVEHDSLVDTLTPRERDVLAQLVAGASNKEAGRQLGISPRTIEIHRARIMEKLGAKNVAELVRMALRLGIQR